eukprot:1019260-Rhodomonas_salina.1
MVRPRPDLNGHVPRHVSRSQPNYYLLKHCCRKRGIRTEKPHQRFHPQKTSDSDDLVVQDREASSLPDTSVSPTPPRGDLDAIDSSQNQPNGLTWRNTSSTTAED